LATAKPGGIFVEISLFENPHDLLTSAPGDANAFEGRKLIGRAGFKL
jgi:hypothetical protein